MWISIKEKPENKKGLFVVLGLMPLLSGQKIEGIQMAEYNHGKFVDAHTLEPIEKNGAKIIYYFKIPESPLSRSRKLINENHPCRKELK